MNWKRQERDARIANQFEQRQRQVSINISGGQQPEPSFAAGLATGYGEGLRAGRRGR